MKRRLLKLGVFLLLGATLNIVVAIVLAKSQRAGWVFGSPVLLLQDKTMTYSESTWFVATVERFGALDVATCGLRPGQCLLDIRQWDAIVSSYVTSFDELRLPSWCFASRTPKEVALRKPFVCVDEAARGWPMLCFRYEIRSNLRAAPKSPSTNGIVWAFDGRPVPGLPIWSGVAFNTLFYSAVLWFLLCVPREVRRLVRVRQHRCPACGFIIAPGTCANGLCSECGATLPWMRVGAK